MSDRIFQLAKQVGEALKLRQQTVSTAESCTGGLLAGAITEIAGSSAWFEQGFVTYANQAKQQLLGVPGAALENHGAVSEQVVEAMALGAVNAGADWGVATSGIAGPDGGTPTKPVGTVWFGWACEGGSSTEVICFAGDRQQVREQAVIHALQGLLKEIHKTTV
ncbi:nicotinamide-nucleotide amidase [Maricurvus nonylphenolicus]|uniref:nicotinamide-nucleotide amidase n=1 Tax=Maricurvus nonylphenolicus TaxID=1008307 RepID=UPI0036F2E63E